MNRRTFIKCASALLASSAVMTPGLAASMHDGPMLVLCLASAASARSFHRRMSLRGHRSLLVGPDLADWLASEILPHARLPSARLAGVTSGRQAVALADFLQDRGFIPALVREIDARCGGTCRSQVDAQPLVQWELVRCGIDFGR